MDKYPVSIKWSDEDLGFIATVPGASGLSAFGESMDEALSELKTAAAAYFRSLKKAGRPMPIFDKITPFSGQLRLRMPKSMHRELSQAAKNEGVSLNTYLVSLLATGHAGRNLFHKPKSLGRAQAVADKCLKSY
ncbi:MAG: toxin-antitoxin system HicB family antitoxin [Candidatus Aminicenantales bacterium]